MSASATDDLLGVIPHQDFVIFGSIKTPGIATIQGLNSPRNWAIQQGFAQSGASTVYQGTTPVKFKVQVQMWRSLDFVQWDILAAQFIKPPPGVKPLAIGITHPLLTIAPHSISSVVIEDVTGPEQDERGLWTAVIHCLEWKKPQPAYGKPLAAIPGADKAAPTAADLADREIEAKVTTLKALAGG